MVKARSLTAFKDASETAGKITGALIAAPLLVLISFMFFPGPQIRAQERELVVVDDLGDRIKIKREVKRIVSLVPTNSEMVCLLDCSRLAGGTRYDRSPEELTLRIRDGRIKTVGGGFDASLEKIVQIAPDLILANGPSQQKIVAPLKRMGFPVLSVWPRDLEGLKRSFLLLGDIVRRKGKAKKILDEVEKGFAEIQLKVKGKKSKKAYLQIWPDPMITVGKNSFPHWLLSATGGVNIFGDLAFDSGKVSLEWIIERDPEVLIFLTGQEAFAQRIVTRPEWKSIRGVQRSHICFVDSADIRRSVQFLEGLAKIQNCLYRTERRGPADSGIP